MSKPKSEKNIIIPESFLKELLTPSEVRMLKNRWQIVQHLTDGLSIRAIAQKVKVGTDTVVRVSRMVERKQFLQKDVDKGAKNQTPWVFGKSEN